MPIVSVGRDKLFAALGKTYSALYASILIHKLAPTSDTMMLMQTWRCFLVYFYGRFYGRFYGSLFKTSAHWST